MESDRTPVVQRNPQDLGGLPLRTWERMRALIAQTRPGTGWRGVAPHSQTTYPPGIKVSEEEMAHLNLGILASVHR